MPTYSPPLKNSAYVFYVSLVSQANTKVMQANPTLAAGDVKVATDDAAPANLATLPVVDADFTKRVKVSLSAGEMNGDRITVVFADASGSEWCDLTADIATVTNQFDALATQASVNTVDDFLDTEIADIQNRLPAALTSGRMNANVGAMEANVVTDAAVAADVTIASVTGAVGSVTGNVGGNVVGSVASVTAAVTVGTNNDKTGYALSSAGIQAIWDALTSALTTVGSIGKLLVDNINATISSRATPAQVNTEADTALADVGLTTTITGRIDAAVSTRASQASVDDLPTNAELATSQAAADDATLAAIAALNNLSAAQVNSEVLDVLTIDTFAEPSAVPAATSTLKDKINWLFVLARNKLTQTATTQLVRNDADNATVGTSTVSDDGTTAIRGEFS